MEVGEVFEIMNFPLELQEHIVSFVELYDLKNFSRVNKFFFDLTNNEIVEKCGLKPTVKDQMMRFQRRYTDVNRNFLESQKPTQGIWMELSNSKITKMLLRENEPCYINRVLTINTGELDLHNTTLKFLQSGDPWVFILNITCKTRATAWNLLDKWSRLGFIDELSISMDSFSNEQDILECPNTSEYNFHFKKLSLKNVSNPKFISELLNASSKDFLDELSLKNCSTDFEIMEDCLSTFDFYNGMGTTKVDSILKNQANLLTVGLDDIEITKSLLNIFSANQQLKTLKLWYCCISSDVTENSFEFVSQLEDVELFSNSCELSMLIWNNLNNVETLRLSLKSSSGFKVKKLTKLKNLKIEDQTTSEVVNNFFVDTVPECSIPTVWEDLSVLPECETLIILEPINSTKKFDYLLESIKRSREPRVKTVNLEWVPITPEQIVYVKQSDPNGVKYNIKFSLDSFNCNKNDGSFVFTAKD